MRTILICIGCILAGAAFAQTRDSIRLGFNNAPALSVFRSIETGAQVTFAYNREDIDAAEKLTLPLAKRRLEDLLAEVGKHLGLDLKRVGNYVVVTPGLPAPEPEKPVFRISGIVVDEHGECLPGATIRVKNTTTGTVAGTDGQFRLEHDHKPVLICAYTGYETCETPTDERNFIKITLKEITSPLREIAVVGSRSNIPRTDTERPAPVDLLCKREMASTGQTELGQILHFLAPSFNSSRQTIADGTDHIDPATLRSLGPDQLLVLVNGKRRHSSALVNVNSTVGRGSVGTDLNALPAGQIERVEILRDGAAAQYGSDAIAGVINIVLKKDVRQGFFAGQLGQTAEGDGRVAQGNLNYGLRLGKQGGFLNANFDFRHRTPTNRTGAYNGLVYLDIPAGSTSEQMADVRKKDEALASERRFNRYGMTVGNSRSTNAGVFFNLGMPLGAGFEWYSFGGVNRRKGQSVGFYRYPGDARTRNLRLYPDGYLPRIETDIDDYSLTAGLRRKSAENWNIDFSTVYGGNRIRFDVSNSLNASLGDASPTQFYVGTLAFNQNTTNVNLSKIWKDAPGLECLNLAFGAELRIDNYRIEAGETASYIDGNPPGTHVAAALAAGSQGFNGFRPENEISANRANAGFYIDAEADVTNKLLLSGALRCEFYSNFGGNLASKVTGRYKLADFLSMRAGYNRGFRAPSLHQQWYSAVTTQFITVDGINRQRKVNTVRHDAPIARALELPALRPEQSNNYSIGIAAAGWEDHMAFTLDAYQIDIRNRIVISGRFSSSVPQLAQYFAGTEVTEAQFFTNAIDTRTRGFDAVLTFKHTPGPRQKLILSSALNLNNTRIKGGAAGVRTPAALAGLGETLLNREERGRIELNQPHSKFIASADYRLRVFNAVLRCTRFGKIGTIAPQDPAQDQIFSAKWLTDARIAYTLFERLTLALGGNNVFNVYPDKVADPRLTNYNTVIYSRFATQFGFNGAYAYVEANYRF
jgi:iron complex outermembrane recepter protein